MALQGSGEIRMSQINTELGRSSTSAISLNSAEDGGYAAINQCSPSRPSSSDPASMSEWYGYNHTFACCNAPSISAGNVGSNSLGFSISYSNCTAMHLEYSSNGGSSWSTTTGGCTSYATLSSLSSSTTYSIRVRITCSSTGGYSAYSNTISMTTSGGCAASGTYLSQFCSGCNLYYRYADGSCGTYDVNQGCTTGCGGCCCSPANGTYLYDGCVDCDYYYYYSDGCNGTYSTLIESASSNCGPRCGGGKKCYTYYSDGSGAWSGQDCLGNFVEGWSPSYGEYIFCGTSINNGGFSYLEECLA
jgi:hypothetical protein